MTGASKGMKTAEKEVLVAAFRSIGLGITDNDFGRFMTALTEAGYAFSPLRVRFDPLPPRSSADQHECPTCAPPPAPILMEPGQPGPRAAPTPWLLCDCGKRGYRSEHACKASHSKVRNTIRLYRCPEARAGWAWHATHKTEN